MMPFGAIGTVKRIGIGGMIAFNGMRAKLYFEIWEELSELRGRGSRNFTDSKSKQ